MVVAVTGASGQVGQAIQSIAHIYPELDFHFASSTTVDITNKDDIYKYFLKCKPNVCINAAAYTAVDKAESEPDQAFSVNVKGTVNLAEVCKEQNILLIHISTDFVFDGLKKEPYTEEDIPNPKSIYGLTKLQGEREIISTLDRYFIIRTSWIYSHFGKNFMKTVLRMAEEKKALTIVNDQIGTPTNAIDLAKALIVIIKSPDKEYGIYNFSNEGSCSWYDFAKKICELRKLNISIEPISTDKYPTSAKRPTYSVLDKSKIKRLFDVDIDCWTVSLEKNI